MAMGETGMGAHAEHAKHMQGPPNTLPMMGGEGPFGNVGMGGMFTILKVRDDFKSVEGDRAMGLDSLPVIFGITRASWICVLMIDIFQALMAAYLISVGENLYATILILFIIPQITLQDMYFLRDPVKNDVKYQASAQPFLVLGMLVTGIAMGHTVLM